MAIGEWEPSPTPSFDPRKSHGLIGKLLGYWGPFQRWLEITSPVFLSLVIQVIFIDISNILMVSKHRLRFVWKDWIDGQHFPQKKPGAIWNHNWGYPPCSNTPVCTMTHLTQVDCIPNILISHNISPLYPHLWCFSYHMLSLNYKALCQ